MSNLQNSIAATSNSINSQIEKLQEQTRLQNAKLAKFIKLKNKVDFSGIEKFIASKGLTIIRCNVFISTDRFSELTQEAIDSAKLSAEFYVDATNFKAIKQCKFNGYTARGDSKNEAVRNMKAKKFVEIFETALPSMKCSTNQFCFEESSRQDRGYNISFSLTLKCE